MSHSTLLVDDDPAMLERLQRIFLSLLQGNETRLLTASSIAQAKALSERHALAMALVDMELPDGNGIELIEWLRTRHAETPILVISAWSAQELILGSLGAGANGYLLKERDDLEVMLSIRSVLRGGAPIDPFIARRIIAELQPSTPAAHKDLPPESALSSREVQILKLVADGMTNREIAESLFLSRYTVECHIKNIYRKLSVPSRTKAVSEARARGLLA